MIFMAHAHILETPFIPMDKNVILDGLKTLLERNAQFVGMVKTAAINLKTLGNPRIWRIKGNELFVGLMHEMPMFECCVDGLRDFDTLCHYNHTHVDQIHAPQYVGKRLFMAHASDKLLSFLELCDKTIAVFHEIECLVVGGLSAAESRA